MSVIDKQENQLEMADARSTVISISGQDRTEQSETRHSHDEGGTCADGSSSCLTRHLLAQAQVTDGDGSALNAGDDRKNLSPEARFIEPENHDVGHAVFTDSLRRKGKTQTKAQIQEAEINYDSSTENCKTSRDSEDQDVSLVKDPDTSRFPGVGKNSVKLIGFVNKDSSKPGDENTTDFPNASKRDTAVICQDKQGGSSRDPTSIPHRPGKLGMLPNTNWKRVRNTLKAASEMQGPKKHKHTLDREDSFLRKFSTRNHQDLQNSPGSLDDEDHRSSCSFHSYEGRFVIQHDGTFMFYWLGVITLAVLYNIWTCIARQAFVEIQQGCPPCWYTFDGVFDFLYICDILVQFRTGYLDQGLMVYDSKKLFVRYVKSKCIYVDFLCLLPLDLIQFVIGVHPMIRFPRFFKLYRTFRFVYMLESRTAYPNLFRVANLTHLVLLGAHWFAAFYYMISEAEKFTGNWSYPKPIGQFAEISRKYLQCLHWAVLTLTTIGDLPLPDNANQYVFTIGSYLIGVFVFATIVGQVGNVINNRNASRIEFERLLDGAKVYMQTHNVPHNLQKRVQRWYDYVWSRGRLNGCDINSLGLLPDKLKTELAIHVNLETLRKVTIFQECQPEFLHDLVLKMKAYIFTPGDLICRRGEVAREMFIIADGVVEIISETGIMLKRMGAGDFFGEIGILNLDGGINRRSADVRSVGYLELFVLSREDVLEALKDHPDAETVIREYGHRRLREVEFHRLKVKPVSPDSLKDQSPNSSGATPAVHNRLLYTLRSLNSAMRRQSSQTTNKQVSPPAATSSNVQRCVTIRESPAKSLDNDRYDTQGGLAIVSVDKPVYSTGVLSGRFSESSRHRRKGFGYLQAAFAKFKKTFHRRKGKQRSLSISDSPRRKSTENRLLLKPVDDHSVTVDLNTYPSSFRTGCHVTVNIENLPKSDIVGESERVRDQSWNITNANNTSTYIGAERNPALELTTHKTSVTGVVLDKSTGRKYPNSAPYASVSNEDSDDKNRSGCLSNGDNDAAESRPQIILDVGKINTILKRETAEFDRDKTNSDSFRNYGQAGRFGASSIYDNSFALNSTHIIPNSSLQQRDNIDENLKHSLRNHKISRNSLSNNVGFKTSTNLTAESPLTFLPCEQMVGSVLPEPGVDASDSSGIFGTRSLYLSPKKSVHFSPQLENGEKDVLLLNQLDNHIDKCRFPVTAAVADEVNSITSSAERTFRTVNAKENSRNTRCLLSGSSVQYIPPRELPASDDFQKTTDSHQFVSLKPCLVRSNLGSGGDISSTSASRHQAVPKVRSLSNSDASSKMTSLSSGRVTPKVRTSSFPALSRYPPQPDTDGQDNCRPTSLETCEQNVIDELAGGLSPPYNRVLQNGSPTVKVPITIKSGRSQPMSIIQQLTSDISYQQLVTVISNMQEVIDKRLTHLEEVFVTTSNQLERLAASQDALLHLFAQQSEERHAQFNAERRDLNDINYHL